MTLKICLLAAAFAAAGTLRADARADYLAAVEAQKAKQWSEAAQGYMKVTAQLPKYAPAWKQLSIARFYMGDAEGSVASADRYLELQPGDSAFAAWADGARKRLHLPPRATPVPTPGPTLAPTPAPEPTPAGLLESAPPPGADAQAVTADEAQMINAQASAEIGEIEQANTRNFQAEMADEAAAILRRREPARGSLAFGLRLLGGLGMGLGSFKHGEEVNSENTASGVAYDGRPAGGFSGAAELLIIVSERLDFGIGVFPQVWSDNRKSSVTGTVTRSDSSEASAAFLPLMAGLTWHQPLFKDFNGLFGVGLGAVPSARVHVKEQLAQTSLSGLNVTTAEGDLDYGLAPAWQVMAGGEWKVSPKLGFVLAAQFMGASFSDGQGNATYEVTDETGTVLAKGSTAVGPTPLSVMNVNLMAGLDLKF